MREAVDGERIEHHAVTIVAPNDSLRFVTSHPDTVIANRIRAHRRQAGLRASFDQLLPTPDTVAFVFVNGIRTLEPSAFHTGSLLNALVTNTATFPHAFGAAFWNPNLRGVVLKYAGADHCAGYAKRDAAFLTRLTAVVRYGRCTFLQEITIPIADDMGKAVLEFLNTEWNAPDPNLPSADSLAHRLSNYHRVGYHTVAVTHSAGNMLFAQAATRIPALDGVPLQTSACTAAMSMAAPINKENFNIDQDHLRGLTIKSDILLQVPPVGLPNNFPPYPDRWTNETSDSADVAIAAALPFTAKLVQAKWGRKIHDVDNNYMSSRLQPLVVGYLKELYDECRSPN